MTCSCRKTMLNYAILESNRPHAGNNKRPACARIALCALLLAGSAAAQMKSNTITEPVLGAVFDGQTKTIRVLKGIPAASRVGNSMDTGSPLRAVAISSERAYALA